MSKWITLKDSQGGVTGYMKPMPHGMGYDVTDRQGNVQQKLKTQSHNTGYDVTDQQGHVTGRISIPKQSPQRSDAPTRSTVSSSTSYQETPSTGSYEAPAVSNHVSSSHSSSGGSSYASSRGSSPSAPMTDAQAAFWTVVVAIFLVCAGIHWAVTMVQTIGILPSVNFLVQLPMVMFYRYSGYWVVQSIWDAYQVTGFASFVMSVVAWFVLLLILPFWKQVLGLGIVGIITLVAWIIIF